MELDSKKTRFLTLSNFMRNSVKGPLGFGHFGKVWLVTYQPMHKSRKNSQHLMI